MSEPDYKAMWLKLKAALERHRESEGADAEYCLVFMERIEKGEDA